MLHICTPYPATLLQDVFACKMKCNYASKCWQRNKMLIFRCPTAVSAGSRGEQAPAFPLCTKTKGLIYQPTSHFQGPWKSLAVARNPRRHIFNLSLSYHRALTQHVDYVHNHLFTLISSPGKHHHHDGLFSNFSTSSLCFFASSQTLDKLQMFVCLIHAVFLTWKEDISSVQRLFLFGGIFVSRNVCVWSFRREPKPSGLVPH